MIEKLMLDTVILSVVEETIGEGEDSFPENQYRIDGEKLTHEETDENFFYDYERTFFYRFLFSKHYAIKLKEKYDWQQTTKIEQVLRGTPEEIETLWKGFGFYF